MFSFSDLCKGILVGAANILPGISGSALAVSMGIYGQIIHAITHVLKKPKESLKTLSPYILGALCGVIGLSFTIEYLFTTYPLQTSLIFMGLILGGVPSLFSNTIKDSITPSCIGLCAFTFLLITGMTLLQSEGSPVQLSPSLSSAAKLFPLGLLSAATLVVPGVSGSMILMMMGYYQPLLSAINQFLRNMASFHIASAWTQGLILAPFAIGILIGLFLCAKLMDALLTRFGAITYSGILGLVFSSPLVILLEIPQQFLTTSNILTGIFCFFVSLTFTCWHLGHQDSAKH